MTKPEALDFVWATAGGIASFLAFVAVVLLGLSLVGMVRR